MSSVRSEISGTVWKIEVAPGDQVETGQTLMILEAMKMEIPVEAPYAGTVLGVHVQEGQSITEDAVLATLGPSSP